MTFTRFFALGLVSAFALAAGAGCATETEDAGFEGKVAADESEITIRAPHLLGTIEPGSSKTGWYSPPMRSAWAFTARGGDIITITVQSKMGDPVTYLIDDRENVLARNDDAEPGTHDSRIRYTLPLNVAPATFRIAIHDYQQLPATFVTTLDVKPSVTCTYGTTVHLGGDTFPATDGCNTCSCGPDGVICTKKECSCNPKAEPHLHYITSGDQCLTASFSCPMGEVRFTNRCGCGCQKLLPTTR